MRENLSYPKFEETKRRWVTKVFRQCWHVISSIDDLFAWRNSRGQDQSFRSKLNGQFLNQLYETFFFVGKTFIAFGLPAYTEKKELENISDDTFLASKCQLHKSYGYSQSRSCRKIKKKLEKNTLRSRKH